MYYYYHCFPSFEGSTVLFKSDNSYVNSSRSYCVYKSHYYYVPYTIDYIIIFLHHAYTAKIKLLKLLIYWLVQLQGIVEFVI